MSKQTGPIVFTATPEMAKSMKIFKSGATYVAHRAVAVAIGNSSATTETRRTPKKKATKKLAKKVAKKVAKKASKKVVKITKKIAKKFAKKRSVKPEMIVKFVRNNEGCNMTDIEGHTKLPQATIRRVLNSARDSGVLRTEGQRRGLRYFVGQQDAAAVATTN